MGKTGSIGVSIAASFGIKGRDPHYVGSVDFEARPMTGDYVMCHLAPDSEYWCSGVVSRVEWHVHQHYDHLLLSVVLSDAYVWSFVKTESEVDKGPVPVCIDCRVCLTNLPSSFSLVEYPREMPDIPFNHCDACRELPPPF